MLTSEQTSYFQAVWCIHLTGIAPLYGCQVWLPHTELLIWFAYDNASFEQGHSSLLKKIATDLIEKLHMSLLKWTLEVYRRTSNAAIWGDNGRYPLAITLGLIAKW